jgi:hypothetical protein
MDVGIQAEVAKGGVVGSYKVDLLLVSSPKTDLRRIGRDTAAWVPTVITRANAARGPNLITNLSLIAAAPRVMRGVVVCKAA